MFSCTALYTNCKTHFINTPQQILMKFLRAADTRPSLISYDIFAPNTLVTSILLHIKA